MEIFVGSLPFKLKEAELTKLFEQYGTVVSTKIVIDNISRQNKGFGFVSMEHAEEALKAIEALNGFEIMGRVLVVNEAISKTRTQKELSEKKKASHNNNRVIKGGFSRKFKGGND